VIDVLGRDLEEARRVLESAGFKVEVTETRTSRPARLSGALRVVRQRATAGGTVQVMVTRERYEPVPRSPGA
jgi:beta-lactam-binding protein with PASTA domain